MPNTNTIESQPDNSNMPTFDLPSLPSNSVESVVLFCVFVFQVYQQVRQRINAKKIKHLERKPTNITGTLAREHEIDAVLHQILGAVGASKLSLGVCFNGTQTPYGYHFNKVAFSHIVHDDPDVNLSETLQSYPLSNYLEILKLTEEHTNKLPIEVNHDYWLQVKKGDTLLALLKFDFRGEPQDNRLWRVREYVTRLSNLLSSTS